MISKSHGAIFWKVNMYIKILFSSVKYLLRKTRGLPCLTQCGYFFFIDRAFSTTELSLCTAKYILHAKTESNIYLNISVCILCDPVTVWVRRSHRTRLQTCLFKAWRPNPLGQLSAEHINYYTQTIACFFLNCYKKFTKSLFVFWKEFLLVNIQYT